MEKRRKRATVSNRATTPPRSPIKSMKRKVMAEKVGDRDIDSVKTTGASTTGASFKITDCTAQIATTDQTFRRNIAPWTRTLSFNIRNSNTYWWWWFGFKGASTSKVNLRPVIPIGRWWTSKTKTKENGNDWKICHWNLDLHRSHLFL